ncbi:hypothetical protein GCM10022243_23620 [Saccharothrix violaceirubra]|uniref:Uncharacterized protein n=1 Tax=Saccharothrix violaceirubra TaxID=413306 RepID=A0A7W7T738_9PSEU|nr:hypothetical protein [Saccharothrix violaceirubra]MBB4967807.1 hypothetical protein [Saccharothrix violaceirubra]
MIRAAGSRWSWCFPAVVESLERDRDVRHLYLTAVAARVLGVPWERAGRIAGDVEHGRFELGAERVGRFTAELANADDGAALWCGVRFLGSETSARGALQRTLRHEPSRAVRRAVGDVLVRHP